MPRILLDTQSFYDFVTNSAALTTSAREMMRSAENTGELAVSIATVIELRLQLPRQRVAELDDLLGRVPARVLVIPIELGIVQGMDHFDPSLPVGERLIGATAKYLNMTLMSDSVLFNDTSLHVEPTRREKLVVRRQHAD